MATATPIAARLATGLRMHHDGTERSGPCTSHERLRAGRRTRSRAYPMTSSWEGTNGIPSSALRARSIGSLHRGMALAFQGGSQNLRDCTHGGGTSEESVPVKSLLRGPSSVTNLSRRGSPSVFISYAVGPMTAPAKALREALERHDVHPWTVHADVPVGASWENSVDEAIRNADAFVILIAPGDEQDRWLLFETRHILTRVWGGAEARVSVLAPAVGAIPSALRHQDFVSYFAHDEVQIERWASEPGAVDLFVERWLQASRQPQPATPPSRQDQVALWRNALVHIGRGPGPSDEEKQRLLNSLWEELVRGNWAPSDAVPSARLDAALQRAVLAQQFGDKGLASNYFNLASEAVPRLPESADPRIQYAAGLAALGAADPVEAAKLFRAAAALYESSYGALDARTIGALYNLGVALSASGHVSEASAAYESVLERSRDGLGPLHPQTASAAFKLAQLRARAGAVEEAVALLHAAEEAYELVTPADSVELAAVRSELSRLQS